MKRVGIILATVIAMAAVSAPTATGRPIDVSAPEVGTSDLASPALTPRAPRGLALEHVAGKKDNIYYIKNYNSEKCLTVNGASVANGAVVNQYTCVGARNQWWELTFEDDLWFRFRNWNSTLCLSVAGASTLNGAKLIQWTCNGRLDQKFYAKLSPLMARHSRKCVEVQGGSLANNAPVIQWTCNSRTHQQWYKFG